MSWIKAAYIKQPYLFVLAISILLTIPWLSMGEFYTKGEPREASLATYILNTGNWVLPAGYADEVAYKPPFMHWFIAVFSFPKGYVTETTARLPSALGLIGITVIFFSFLYKRKKGEFAALAALLLLTSFEMHRSGIEARVDMFLAFFMFAALISLFKWEEKGLKGYPVLIPVLLGSAALIKGPVGIVLPCLVFGIYLLLLRRYSFWEIVVKNIVLALPALAILLTWYFFAYQQGGSHFLNVVYAENFGRFLGQDSKALGISYDLGHKGPFWYYIPAILLGFMPWSFVAIFSLLGIRLKNISLRNKKQGSIFQRLSEMDKVTLFSIVSVVIILIFYAIPSSKRSVYIMPAYPFAAYLLAMLYEWVVENRPKRINWLGYIVLFFAGLVLIITVVFTFADLNSFLPKLIHDAKTINDAGLFFAAFHRPTILPVLLWMVLLAVLICCAVILKRRNYKILVFACIGLYMGVQIFLEGAIYPIFKDGYSSKPFAQKIESKYDLKGKTYVMNDLRNYMNLYGLNFYLGNNFKNFDKEQPDNGYFLTGSTYIDRIQQQYAGKYKFEELERTTNRYNDFADVIILYKIVKVGTVPVR
jgi:4-amino-4-deoxy-L-arabinose transferase-like glycosyltransferase